MRRGLRVDVNMVNKDERGLTSKERGMRLRKDGLLL